MLKKVILSLIGRQLEATYMLRDNVKRHKVFLMVGIVLIVAILWFSTQFFADKTAARPFDKNDWLAATALERKTMVRSLLGFADDMDLKKIFHVPIPPNSPLTGLSPDQVIDLLGPPSSYINPFPGGNSVSYELGTLESWTLAKYDYLFIYFSDDLKKTTTAVVVLNSRQE